METPRSTPLATRPVFVGVDGSSCSVHALMWAADEAVSRGVPLRIVHVWAVPALAFTTPVVPPMFIDPTIYETEARQTVADAAHTVAERLGRDAPHIETHVVAGDPGRGLAAVAGDGAVLVVGSHGRGPVARAVLGSVAERCVAHAEVPVVVVRSEVVSDGAGPVVVGIEDTPESRAALEWAVLEAGRRGRRLVVVHAHDVERVLRPDLDGLPEDANDEMVVAGRSFLDHLLTSVARIGSRPRSVAWRVVVGRPDEVLVRAAEGASMLVVGSPNRHGAREHVTGSTAAHCTRSAACPVVVVRSKVADEEQPELECAS